MRSLAAVALASVSAVSVSAQQKIPVIQLSPIEVKGAEVVSTGSPMRAMSTGAVLLNDVTRKRLLLFEPSLMSFTVVTDSTKASSSPMAALFTGIIPFTGDSSLIVDQPSASLLVIAPDGRTTRVMALPKAADIVNLGGNPLFGAPTLDPKGRLIYRANYPQDFSGVAAGKPPAQPDSAPIVRADFDSRTVDTIAVLKVPVPGKIIDMDMSNPASPKLKLEINPMPLGNEWAVLSDGTIAVVHAQDYHVEFIDIDGKRRSAPKMPFDWRRASDEEKQVKVDSVKTMFDSTMKAQAGMLPPGQRMPAIELVFPKFSDLPDYHPPIRPGSVRADADGYLWILPSTSSQANGGLVYDVVTREGTLFQRVQLPPQTIIGGFAKGGVVYLYHYTDASGVKATIERARVTFLKGATP